MRGLVWVGARGYWPALLPLLLVVALTGCGDDVQFAEPPQRDVASGHGAPGIPHAPRQPAADPFAAADVSAGNKQEAGDPGEVVYAGTVTLADGVSLPSPLWIWVSAGHAPTGRPPVLTKLYENPAFPFTFELRRRDTAFPGAAVPDDADLVLYVSVGKNRFVEGIVLKVPPTEAKSMGAKDINIQVKKP